MYNQDEDSRQYSFDFLFQEDSTASKENPIKSNVINFSDFLSKKDQLSITQIDPNSEEVTVRLKKLAEELNW